MAFATDHLAIPPGTLIVLVLYFGVFVVWPAASAIVRRQALWALLIVVVAPLGAVLWWIVRPVPGVG